tara:strand:- start:1928 stop:2077 length:150 start_codon:yes stop_codon:yes gene_type:complete
MQHDEFDKNFNSIMGKAKFIIVANFILTTVVLGFIGWGIVSFMKHFNII